jgi:hypothetical protein
MNVVGYGVCGANEKRLKATLDEFKRLCDHAVIVGNNIDDKSAELITSYGFELRHDNRVWGENQHRIKQDLVDYLKAYNPDWLICLDMDEVFDPSLTRELFESYTTQCDSMYVYIANLWGKGWKRQWSFWNIRAWKWNGQTKFVNRPLHCGLAPEWAYHYGSYVPVILWHYGLKEKAVRKRKIDRYKQFDPNAVYRDKSYYDALADDSFDAIDTAYIQEAIEREALPIKRKTMQTVEKEFVYVKRADGKVFDIPKKSLEEHLKRGFTVYES